MIEDKKWPVEYVHRYPDGPMDFSHLYQEVELPLLHSQEGHQGQAQPNQPRKDL